MFVNLLIWLVLIVVTIFLIWLTVRAWRARRWFVRIPGGILAGLLALIFLALDGMGGYGLYQLYVPLSRPTPVLQVKATPEMVARGEHLANVFCVSCHSPTSTLPLIGGVDLAKDVPLPIGSMVGINLTPAGPIKGWTDGQLMRVFRENLSPSGLHLLGMSTTRVRYLSDADLQAIIAYLRSTPAIGSPTQDPPDQMNFLGVLITGSNIMPFPAPVTTAISAPPEAATAAYGQYILSYQDCRSCHGANLLGGTNQLSPNGPGLRIVRGMTQAQFITMMRTGARPDGTILKAPMPWKVIGRMDDVELAAVYQYLISIP